MSTIPAMEQTSEETQQEGMPLADFLEQGSRQRFELINGKKVPKMPDMFEPKEAIHLLYDWLKNHLQHGTGGTVYMEMTFVMPDTEKTDRVKGSRIPDVSFYAPDRIERYKKARQTSEPSPLSIVPDFVIEVVSPTDRYSEILTKVDAYLLDGVRLIWLIDPQRKNATIFAPDLENPIVVKGDAILNAGDVVLGFELNLSKLFDAI